MFKWTRRQTQRGPPVEYTKYKKCTILESENELLRRLLPVVPPRNTLITIASKPPKKRVARDELVTTSKVGVHVVFYKEPEGL